MIKEFLSYDLMWVLLAFIFVVLVVWLYNVSNKDENDISLIDLVATNGKLEERKITRFGAWIVSTWGLVYLISINELKEWYFIAYMGAWVANALIGAYINNSKQRDYMRYGRSYNDTYVDHHQNNAPMEFEGNGEELNNIPKRRRKQQ